MHKTIIPGTMSNHKKTVLLVEDNEQFILLLQIMLEGMPFEEVLVASSYEAALELLEDTTPDIFLLDIELSENEQESGIALGEAIRKRQIDAPIVYITSHYTEDYYERTKHTRPSSFLSKELSRLKLHQAIDLALLNYQEHQPTQQQDFYTSKTPPKVTTNHFFFKIGDMYKAIPIDKIAYFYADKKMSYAKMEVRSYPTSIQLKVLEEELQELGFIRVHKSYLINIKQIEAIHPRNSIVTIAGEELPIGYTYRKPFLEVLNLLK